MHAVLGLAHRRHMYLVLTLIFTHRRLGIPAIGNEPEGTNTLEYFVRAINVAVQKEGKQQQPKNECTVECEMVECGQHSQTHSPCAGQLIMACTECVVAVCSAPQTRTLTSHVLCQFYYFLRTCNLIDKQNVGFLLRESAAVAVQFSAQMM